MKRNGPAIKKVIKETLSLIFILALLTGFLELRWPGIFHDAFGIAPDTSSYDKRYTDTISFGRYEQNGRTGSPEDIEWIVLDTADGKALVISKYILNYMPFGETDTDPSWESSSVRTWLNDTFLNEAFTQEERERIPVTEVSDEMNRGDTDPVYCTEDRIFLLSSYEALSYFSDNEMRMCPPTKYARRLDPSGSTEAYREWWLRTPGTQYRCIACVSADGSVDSFGKSRSYPGGGIRPVMWIEL